MSWNIEFSAKFTTLYSVFSNRIGCYVCFYRRSHIGDPPLIDWVGLPCQPWMWMNKYFLKCWNEKCTESSLTADNLSVTYMYLKLAAFAVDPIRCEHKVKRRSLCKGCKGMSCILVSIAIMLYSLSFVSNNRYQIYIYITKIYETSRSLIYSYLIYSRSVPIPAAALMSSSRFVPHLGHTYWAIQAYPGCNLILWLLACCNGVESSPAGVQVLNTYTHPESKCHAILS